MPVDVDDNDSVVDDDHRDGPNIHSFLVTFTNNSGQVALSGGRRLKQVAGAHRWGLFYSHTRRPKNNHTCKRSHYIDSLTEVIILATRSYFLWMPIWMVAVDVGPFSR